MGKLGIKVRLDGGQSPTGGGWFWRTVVRIVGGSSAILIGLRRKLLKIFPTRGLDVGSIEDIRKLLLEQHKEGSTIFLISGDLDEIMMLSDRIAVIYEGRLMEIVDVDEVNKEDVGLMMTGFPKEEVF